MATVQKVPTGSFHPGYGCAILIIAVFVFGGLVSWMIYSGYEQDRQISLFTVPEAPPLQSAAPSPADKDAMKKRLMDFSKASTTGPAKISLSTADINTLVVMCAEANIADYRGIVWFTGADEKNQALKADIHWKMNNMPFTERKDRFLVGHAVFKLGIENGALETHIENVEVPGKTVSEGFVHQLGNWPWLNLVKIKPEMSDFLKKITAFKIMPDGSLELEAKPVPAPGK